MSARVTSQLVDSFGRPHTYLRISVTDRCNLRCTYCMPPQGIDWKPREEILTFEEILRLARVLDGHGIRKIRLTGGEPLVRTELEQLAQSLSALPHLEHLTLTTNGILLKQKAKVLKRAGVTGITVSLDTLRRERFEAITKRDYLPAVQEGIEAVFAAGFNALKINVVVMAGVNDDELLDFMALTHDRPIHVRFIEYMPFQDNQWSQGGLLPYAEMRRLIETRYTLIPQTQEASAVSKDFTLPGFAGQVGFVTSMTQSFCGTCNRIRLTADGAIKSCLFHPSEVSLRDAMRNGATDESLIALIQKALWQKQAAHLPMEELARQDNRPMIAIGG